LKIRLLVDWGSCLARRSSENGGDAEKVLRYDSQLGGGSLGCEKVMSNAGNATALLPQLDAPDAWLLSEQQIRLVEDPSVSGTVVLFCSKKHLSDPFKKTPKYRNADGATWP
jgi:hypothetical protein